MLLDAIDVHSKALQEALLPYHRMCQTAIEGVAKDADKATAHHLGSKKLSNNAIVVIAGLLISSVTNRTINEISGATRSPADHVNVRRAS
jgi:hypothetical protein